MISKFVITLQPVKNTVLNYDQKNFAIIGSQFYSIYTVFKMYAQFGLLKDYNNFK